MSLNNELQGAAMFIRLMLLSAIFVCCTVTVFASDEKTGSDSQSDQEIQRTIKGRHVTWEKFTNNRLNSLLKQNRTVLLVFVAKWDVNSIVNERLAYDTEDTANELRKLSIVPTKAAHTRFFRYIA